MLMVNIDRDLKEESRALALRQPPGAPLQVRSGPATRSGAPTALRASHLERRSDSAPTPGALALRLRSSKNYSIFLPSFLPLFLEILSTSHMLASVLI